MTALELSAATEDGLWRRHWSAACCHGGWPVATALDLRAATEDGLWRRHWSCVLPRRTACGDNTGQLWRQHWSAVRRATAVGSPKNQDDLDGVQHGSCGAGG